MQRSGPESRIGVSRQTGDLTTRHLFRAASEGEKSMTTAESIAGPDERAYRQRIRAWTMYDWANSAFATTILAAVLPVYYSQVAGATLPSEVAATAMWSMGLSISLFIVALLSPILGTISDVVRGKKRFLAVFAGLGIVGTGLLVLVSTGDWLLASLLFIFGRIGFTAANVFYDSLLPHVARPEDRDRVSATGYAMGYVGGGLLLALNVVMIQVWGGFWGSRLSFLSVAIWWAIFSIPVFRRVPEPPTAEVRLAPGENVISIGMRRLRETFGDIQQYRELFKFLIAFLIYNDGIGTIIGVAGIYGAELGLGTTELILALLLVQFVAIPFSLVFGRLPGQETKYRPQFLAFVLFDLVMLPVVGVAGLHLLPGDLVGAPPPPYAHTSSAVGEGVYPVSERGAIVYGGEWETMVVPAEDLSGGGFFEFVSRVLGEPAKDVTYATTREAGARYAFAFNGQAVTITYGSGPDHGLWAVELDRQPAIDEDGEPAMIDAWGEVTRYGESRTFTAEEPGEHVLSVINTGEGVMSVAQVEVLPPARKNNLLIILVLVVAVNVAAVAFGALLGRALFSGLAALLDTRRSVILALSVYAVIAVWGFFLNSTIEFWFLAWMVSVVLGGSQALSRSLYASMSPAAKSGEFFGLFGVMEKFSAILGPILFAAAGTLFGSSRPAILSLILFFLVGIFLLMRVDVEKGRQVAQAEDAALLGGVEGA